MHSGLRVVEPRWVARERGAFVKKSESDGFRLIYTFEGKPLTREFHQPQVLVGRSVVCDLVIESANVGRKHAVILRSDEGWSIDDLNSRTGTAVNQQRISRVRLRDGDQITLGVTSPEPIVLTFQPARRQPRAADRVVLCDDAGSKNVVASIDLKELEQTLFESGPPRRTTVRGPGTRGLSPPRTTVPSDPLAAVLDVSPQLPLLRLFKQVGEILLASESLDDMLQKIVNLAVDHLPGQRGVICLYDEPTGAIEPKVFRDKAEGDRPFLVSRTILREAIHVRQAMLITSAVDDPRFHAAASVHQIGIRAAMCVPLYHAGQIRGLIYVDSQQPSGSLDTRDLEILTVLGLMVAGGISQMALRDDVARERAMRARLSLYNSPRVVEQILKQDESFAGTMLADEYDVSVLFADLTGFTSMTESLSPAQVVHLLNTVFERMVSAVFAQDGTLDKYIGDAVMAVFGTPLRQEDHARRAVSAAMLMQQSLDDFNRSHADSPALRMRIGINSGRVVAGDIGSPVRRAYTVIGDAVNVASRIETDVAQPGEIVLGPATWEMVQDYFECEPLAEVQLRGKRHAIRPYRVLRAK